MQTQSRTSRRSLFKMTPSMTQYVHYRTPWVTAWWSAAFPGLGHIYLGSYIKGFVLFVWELVVNTQANLNLAICYSFTGQYELAKQSVDYRWLLLYAPVYIYGIWTSYRLTVELNKYHRLTTGHPVRIPVSKVSSWEINFLDKRSPWIALSWSLLTPGLGQLYLQRLHSGFFLLIWWIVLAYKSNVALGIHYSLIGDFAAVKQAIHIEWILFMPGVHFFALYDAYVTAVECNRLFDREQRQFLYDNYQSSDFTMPL